MQFRTLRASAAHVSQVAQDKDWVEHDMPGLKLDMVLDSCERRGGQRQGTGAGGVCWVYCLLADESSLKK